MHKGCGLYDVLAGTKLVVFCFDIFKSFHPFTSMNTHTSILMLLLYLIFLKTGNDHSHYR